MIDCAMEAETIEQTIPNNNGGDIEVEKVEPVASKTELQAATNGGLGDENMDSSSVKNDQQEVWTVNMF